MARVPYVAREDLPDDHQRFYDDISNARGGRMANVFSLLLNAPELAGRIGNVGAYLRFASQIPDDAREITILTTAFEMKCQYEFTHHVPIAQRAGVRDEVIQGITSRSNRGLLPKESVFIDYARKVVNNKVDDATYAAIEHLLGRQGAVEITVVAGYYSMLAHSMLALGVELEENVAPLMPA